MVYVQLPSEPKKKTIEWENFRKEVPLKISNSSMSEEEVLRRVHDKLEQALSGKTVSMKLGGINALNLRNYINEKYKDSLKAIAKEGEDGLWTVKVRARSEAANPLMVTVPVKVQVSVPASPNANVRAVAAPIKATDTEAVLDSAQADFVKMSKSYSWKPVEFAEKSAAAREQAKWFMRQAGIDLASYSNEAGKEMVRNVYILFLENDVSSKKLEEAAGQLRASIPEMNAVSARLFSDRGTNSRFSPKEGVSGEDIRMQVFAAYLNKAFQGWNPEFMLLLANYETGMTKVSTSHHGKGPLQLTSASIFSEAKGPAGAAGVNRYLPEGVGLKRKATTLPFVSRNIISNYAAAGETLALKLGYILNSDPSKEAQAIRKAVKQKEQELGRSFKIGDIDSLPKDVQLAAYRRLAFHYNGNPAIQAGYSKSVYNAMANGTWKGAEIAWLAQKGKQAS